MDGRIWVRGRVHSDPVEMDGMGIPVAAFIVENEQTAPGKKGKRKAQVVSWCDVVCDGELASNVLDSLVEGDYVIVEGELRVHRLYAVDDERNSAMVSVRAESVGLDLRRGVAKFLRVQR
jgi:single-stranded DNA-binding protein